MRAAILGLLLFAPITQNTIPTISVAQAATCSVEFDQDASSLAEAQSFQYTVNTDNIAPISTAVTCVGTVSPFQCNVPLQVKTVGTHNLVVVANIVLSDGTILASPPSLALTYRIANAPNAPKNLHIKK